MKLPFAADKLAAALAVSASRCTREVPSTTRQSECASCHASHGPWQSLWPDPVRLNRRQPRQYFFPAAYMLTCMLAVPCGFTQVRPWLYSIEAKRRRDHAHAWCRPYPRPSSTSVGQLAFGWRGHASLVLHVRSQHVWIRAAVQHRLLSTRWVLRALRGMRLALSADQVL